MTKLERFKIKMRLRLIIWTKGRWGGRNIGICHKLIFSVNCSRLLIGPHFMTWDKFSGSIDYPVPHPRFIPNSERAEQAYYEASDMYSGDYGRLRLDLAKHLLKSL